jgi:hypothetical protein
MPADLDCLDCFWGIFNSGVIKLNHMLSRALLAVFVAFLLVSTTAMYVNAQVCLDEGKTKPCGSNIGICEAGTQSCQGGEWTECADDVEPELETCDNELDDDCDGLVDECLDSVWPIMIFAGVIFLFFMVMLVKLGF